MTLQQQFNALPIPKVMETLDYYLVEQNNYFITFANPDHTFICYKDQESQQNALIHKRTLRTVDIYEFILLNTMRHDKETLTGIYELIKEQKVNGQDIAISTPAPKNRIISLLLKMRPVPNESDYYFDDIIPFQTVTNEAFDKLIFESSGSLLIPLREEKEIVNFFQLHQKDYQTIFNQYHHCHWISKPHPDNKHLILSNQALSLLKNIHKTYIPEYRIILTPGVEHFDLFERIVEQNGHRYQSTLIHVDQNLASAELFTSFLFHCLKRVLLDIHFEVLTSPTGKLSFLIRTRDKDYMRKTRKLFSTTNNKIKDTQFDRSTETLEWSAAMDHFLKLDQIKLTSENMINHRYELYPSITNLLALKSALEEIYEQPLPCEPHALP